MTSTAEAAGTGQEPRPGPPLPGQPSAGRPLPGQPPPSRRPPSARRRPLVLAAAGGLVVVGLFVAWMGQRAEAIASGKPGLVWALSPGSNTVTVRLTAGSGPRAQQVLAHSRLIVAAAGTKHPEKAPAGIGKVRVPVPPG